MMFDQDPVHQAILRLSSQKEDNNNNKKQQADNNNNPAAAAAADVDVVDTTCYFRAVECCPDVIRNESPHELFFRFCNRNVEMAAARLANYWNVRRQVFGSEEAAFRPLCHCFSLTERSMIARGVVVTLPPTSMHGRSVLWIDRYRINTRPSQSYRLRDRFWLLQSLSEAAWRRVQQQQQQQDHHAFEAVLVVVLQPHSPRAAKNPEMTEIRKRMLANAICLDFVQVHGVVAIQEDHQVPTTRHILETIAPITLGDLRDEFHIPKTGTNLHHGDSTMDVLESLQAAGFDQARIPPTGGGSWSYEEDWLARLQKQGLIAPAPAPAAAAAPVAPRIIEAAGDVSAVTCGVPSPAFDHHHHHPVHEAILRMASSSNSRKDTAFGDAYLQAAKRCPDVVHAESPHEQFLAFCDHNVLDAATRLAEHWQVRFEIFGQQAFQPLVQALPDSTVENIFKGSIAVMCPPTTPQGKPVLVLDRGRGTAPATVDCRMKELWFSTHMMSLRLWNRYKQSGNFEYVLIYLLRQTGGQRIAQSSKSEEDLRKRIYTQAQCLKPAEVHGVAVHQDRGAQRTLLQTVAPVTLQAFERLFFRESKQRATVHVGASPAEALASLQSHGFVAECLPASCGGTWSYDEHIAFLEGLGLQQKSLGSAKSSFELPPEDIDGVVVPPIEFGKPPATASMVTTEVRSGVDQNFYEKPVVEASHVQVEDYSDSSLSAQLEHSHHIVLEAMSSIAADEAESFWRAYTYNPQVVQSETRLDWFLLHCRGDACAAARRLATYWYIRELLYGTDFAFFPLAHALRLYDFALLMRGEAGFVLPLSSRNSHGRPIFYLDGSLGLDHTATTDLTPHLRAMGFLLRSLCDMAPRTRDSNGMPQAVTAQAVCLCYVDTGLLEVFGPELAEWVGKIIEDAVCLEFAELHLVVTDMKRHDRPSDETNAEMAVVEETKTNLEKILSVARNLLTDMLGRPPITGSSRTRMSTHVHTGRSVNEIRRSLSSAGLSSLDCLPIKCGGTLTVDAYWPVWLHNNESIQEALSKLMAVPVPATSSRS